MTNHNVFFLQFEYYHLDSFTSLQPTWRQKAQASRDELILGAISATVTGFLWGEGDIGQHPGCDMIPAIEVSSRWPSWKNKELTYWGRDKMAAIF